VCAVLIQLSAVRVRKFFPYTLVLDYATCVANPGAFAEGSVFVRLLFVLLLMLGDTCVAGYQVFQQPVEMMPLPSRGRS